MYQHLKYPIKYFVHDTLLRRPISKTLFYNNAFLTAQSFDPNVVPLIRPLNSVL